MIWRSGSYVPGYGLWPMTEVVTGHTSQEDYEKRIMETLIIPFVGECLHDYKITPHQLELMIRDALDESIA